MKKKYSTLLNFALAGCLATTLVACGSDGDKTGSTGTKYSNPKIDIGGVVQDTNGNPLADVSVSCQAKSATTNDLGQYIIKGLKVTNVAGADNDTAHNPVSCVIGAPSGYLGATVTVYPEAQIDDAPSTGGFLDGIVGRTLGRRHAGGGSDGIERPGLAGSGRQPPVMAGHCD